jgi:hypothetical protein
MKKKKTSIYEILLVPFSFGITAFIASYINDCVQGDVYSILKLVLVFGGCFLVDFLLIVVIYQLRRSSKNEFSGTKPIDLNLPDTGRRGSFE